MLEISGQFAIWQGFSAQVTVEVAGSGAQEAFGGILSLVNAFGAAGKLHGVEA